MSHSQRAPSEDDSVKSVSQRGMLWCGSLESGQFGLVDGLCPDRDRVHWWLNECDVVVVDVGAHALCNPFVKFRNLAMDVDLPCIRCPPAKFSDGGIIVSHDFEGHGASCAE